MNQNELLQSFYRRLKKEALLKSFLWGAVVGFALLCVSAALLWFSGNRQIWICAVIFFAAFLSVGVIFYFRIFRPKEKLLARRVDGLGLEERVVTMMELTGQDTFIAKRQREDTVDAVNSVNAQSLKITVSAALLVCAVVSGILGVGMTTVAALSAADVIRSGAELVNPSSETGKFYEIIYDVCIVQGNEIVVYGEGGLIDGELIQIVAEGESGESVWAEAEDGYIFVRWSDGVETPGRRDADAHKDLTLYAMFEEAVEGDGMEMEGDEGEESDEKKPNDEGPEGDENDRPSDPGDESSGRYEENNQVYDGETYYGDEYEGAYEYAEEVVDSDDSLSEEEKELIKEYFNNIAR